MLNSYKSYINVEFDEYYKANNIILLCLPAYFSYLIKSLNISIFGLLKKAYVI